MNPDIQELQRRVELLEFLLNSYVKSDRYLFQKHIEVSNGYNFIFGGAGTKFGTATTQKIGFFNHTPVTQQGAVTTPSGGSVIDTESRTAIGQIKTGLQNLGLTA